MRLSSLLEAGNFLLPSEFDCDIAHLTLDSRCAAPGSLFIALKGNQLDGRRFITQAVEAGANAVLMEAVDSSPIFNRHPAGIPLISVPELRGRLGQLAAHFYHYPANQLRMIGVTGTNGKTTCTHFIAQLLEAEGIACGLIGTLGNGFFHSLRETMLTTPDAITLQATMASLLKAGAKAVAMEVSSHSIDQERVRHIPYEIGIFTNLTQDHLDYHLTMENYAAVKKRFLTTYPLNHVILNIDDSYGQQWFEALRHHPSLYGYSLKPHQHAKVYATHYTLSLAGICAHVITPWGEADITLPLIGEFNLSNALAALCALGIYGIPFQDILQHLPSLQSVPGRMQLLREPGKPLCVVDYAHTPDSLEKALKALRSHTKGNLYCVFGCGGNRDAGKRPIMAGIAQKWSDQVIVTSDNPRDEQPEHIIKEIVKGFRGMKHVIVETDRSKAIEISIQLAKEKDCVLIAGKGAECYQQMGGIKIPFNDAEKVMHALKSK